MFNRRFWLAVCTFGLMGRHGVAQKEKEAANKACPPSNGRILVPGNVTIGPAGTTIEWTVTEKCGDDSKVVTLYAIGVNRVTMTVNGETRYFNPVEAEQVRSVLGVLAKYARDSTIWWLEGYGSKTPADAVRPTRSLRA